MLRSRAVALKQSYVYKEVLWKHHGTVKKLIYLFAL